MAGKRKEKWDTKNLNINGFPIKYKNKMFGTFLCCKKKLPVVGKNGKDFVMHTKVVQYCAIKCYYRSVAIPWIREKIWDYLIF